MIYRYTLIAFIASISLILISAGLSTTTTEVAEYNPLPTYSGGPGTGGLGDRTGSPLSAATCSACHSGGLFNAAVSIQLFDGPNPTTTYVAGNTYNVEYSVTGTASAYGFQCGVLTSANAAGGTFSLPSANAQVVTIAGRSYIEHDNGASPTGNFQATWTAPVANSGTVSFYGIGVAANLNGGTSGDQVAATVILSLTEVVPTTITYPGTPFCSNESSQIPVVTGELTGTYSSTPGLSINATTGVINVVTSAPGTYSVSYAYSTGITTFSITINPAYSSVFSASICDNETFTFGSQVLDASNAGLNVETFQAVNGCDSIVELMLDVLPTIVETDAVTICEGDTYDFNGQTLTSANAGLNTAVLQSANGCDSTVNLTLTVEAIDLTVGLVGAVLTANQAGAAYQWVDCDNGNAAINGEISATYSPTVTGNYAVEITLNGCTETSVCTLVDFTSIDELNINSSVVFPNPVSDVFEIKNIEQFGTINSISLMDVNGKVVRQISINDNSTNIGNLDAGVYFLRIVSESGDSIISVVKK